MRQNGLDRRTFVMGSFGFCMAVLGGGMLAGCVAAEEQVAENDAREQGESGSAESVAPESAPEPAGRVGRALVAVFSYSGTTLSVAERIAEATGADLFRIETTDAYPDDYDAMTSQVRREQDEGYLPPIAAAVPDWDAYDAVYLGNPIWWGRLPHVMRSFLLQHDLAGKAVAPFCTSGGSGIDGALADIRDLCPGANLLDGLTVERSALPDALDQVAPWIEGLGLA